MTESSNGHNLEALTFDSAAAALELGTAALKAGQRVFDLSTLKSSDSSGVAVLLAMQRRARAAGTAVTFINLPPSLQALLELYGVDELLCNSPADLHQH